MRLIIAFTYSMLFCIVAIGQQMPVVIPPSPSAQAFHKYGEYPVALHTGIPDISIPVYEIKTNQLSLPINIKYHSAGFRPNDKNGILGLNWTVSAGGMISRQIRGIPDDAFSSGLLYTHFKYTSNELQSLNNMTAYDFLYDIVDNRVQDSEYDMFSWSVANSSGNFIIKRTGTGTDYTAAPVILTERKTDKITFTKNPTTQRIESFDLINEEGTKYRFGKSYDGADAEERVGDFSMPITSWLLTEIISADLSETIKISYNELGYLQDVRSSYITSLAHKYVYAYTPQPASSSTGYQDATLLYRTRTIKEINFKNGRVKFNYTPDGLWLTDVEVFNAAKKIKGVAFNTSKYESDRNDKYTFYKLDRVVVDNEQVYKFSYNNTPLPRIDNLSEDWWGYYNGGYFPSIMCPVMYLGEGTAQYLVGDSRVSRDANDEMKNLILNKIEYPTGGYSTFEYEVNKYKDMYTEEIKNAGGLRVSRIMNNDGHGNITQKKYKYGSNEDGIGKIILAPYKLNITSNSWFVFWNFMGDPGEPYYYLNTSVLTHLAGLTNYGCNVYYSEVAEYQEDPADATKNTGKTVSNFSDFPDVRIEPTSNALFAYFGLPYSFADQPVISPQEEMIYGSDRFGLLTSKSIYRKVGNEYVLSQKESFDYQIDVVGQLTNLRVSRFARHTSCCLPAPERTVIEDHPPFPGFEPPPPFVYRDYWINVSKITLRSTTTIQYDENNQALVNKTDYWYDNPNHPYPTKTIITQSNGKLQEIYHYRPHDKNLLVLTPEAANAVDNMISRNIISPVLEENRILSTRDEIGDYLMLSNVQTHTDYKIWNGQSHLIKPSEIVKKVYTPEAGTLLQSGQVRFKEYDEQGNILTASKENDVNISYCWGYNSSYPTAEVINARKNEIFYTSFEEANGNSSAGDSKTGQKSKTDGYQMNLTGLSSGKYILSYWQKSGGTWNLHIIPVTVSNSYTISLSGQVDEIRFHPVHARMTTYTYEPLVGMTSQCDANNNITYYEYDSLRRLSIVRDQDRNVIKKMEYKYQSQ